MTLDAVANMRQRRRNEDAQIRNSVEAQRDATRRDSTRGDYSYRT